MNSSDTPSIFLRVCLTRFSMPGYDQVLASPLRWRLRRRWPLAFIGTSEARANVERVRFRSDGQR